MKEKQNSNTISLKMLKQKSTKKTAKALRKALKVYAVNKNNSEYENEEYSNHGDRKGIRNLKGRRKLS